MKTRERNYESPSIEIVELEVEKGFAVTGEVIGSLDEGKIDDWIVGE